MVVPVCAGNPAEVLEAGSGGSGVCRDGPRRADGRSGVHVQPHRPPHGQRTHNPGRPLRAVTLMLHHHVGSPKAAIVTSCMAQNGNKTRDSAVASVVETFPGGAVKPMSLSKRAIGLGRAGVGQ